MGRALTNLIGQKFGRLTVISKAENDKWGHAQWQCSCDCGGSKIVKSGDIGSRINSCGCLNHSFGEKSKTWKGGKIETNCANPLCNKIITKHPSLLKPYKKSYCSHECRTAIKGWNYRPPQKVTVQCSYCEKAIETIPCKAIMYEKHFCKGTDCFARWRSDNTKGESNANYHGGIPEMRIIRKRIAAAMRKAIRQEKAGRTWESLVEYSMADLIDRLKETIPDGYSWENDFINGKGVLHIDHMKPMSSFRFETAEDDNFKQCFALENLQLLPAIENMKKSAKLNYQSI